MAKTIYTLEFCKEVAATCETPKEVRQKNRGAYLAIARNKWQQECFAHMKYAERMYEKWSEAKAKRICDQYNSMKEFRAKEPKCYDYVIREKLFHLTDHMDSLIEDWDAEKLQEALDRCTTVKEFRTTEPKAYDYLIRNGLNHLLEQLSRDRAAQNYWTYERCKEVLSKFDTRKEALAANYACYRAAKRNGWWEELSAHMTELRKPSGYWTKEQIFKDAATCSGIGDFAKKFAGGYHNAIHTYDCLAELQALFPEDRKPPGHWKVKENCLKSAQAYSSPSEWEENVPGAYNSARVEGWLEECCEHMIPSRNPSGYWDRQRIQEAANQYDYRMDFLDAEPSAYGAAQKLGILQEVCAHMKRSKMGFNPDIPGILYYFRIDHPEHGTYWKIGVTNFTVERRHRYDMHMIEVLQVWEYEIGQGAKDREDKVLKQFDEFRPADPPKIFSGGGESEIFFEDVLGLDKLAA